MMTSILWCEELGRQADGWNRWGVSQSVTLSHVVAVVVVVAGALKNLESRQLFSQTVNEWSLLV